jgi:hypothetical protein
MSQGILLFTFFCGLCALCGKPCFFPNFFKSAVLKKESTSPGNVCQPDKDGKGQKARVAGVKGGTRKGQGEKKLIN